MATVQLQGPVMCQNVFAKQGVYISPCVRNLAVVGNDGVAAWGLKRRGLRSKVKVTNRSHLKKLTRTRCSLNPSDGSGGDFKENDEEYVDSSVVDAVQVKSSDGGFVVRMRDGSHLQCVHNNPQGSHVLEFASHPAIVLKMEDGTDLLLPIIVLEMPSMMLMAAIHNIQIARPTIYQVIREMVGKMGYEVKLVRVTKRVREAYFAKLYLAKLGNEEEECISFDLRPSDAINIAVRCKVPIQVNRSLVRSDGMRVVDSLVPMQTLASDGTHKVTELDRPNDMTSIETKEFNILQNMFTAAYEERYKDAALWRDRLTDFRSQKNWI